MTEQEKGKIKQKFMAMPNVDSYWIEAYINFAESECGKTYGGTLDAIMGLSYDKLDMLPRLADKLGRKPAYDTVIKYNITQLQIINKALDEGLDKSTIKRLSPDMPYAQMNWLLADETDEINKFTEDHWVPGRYSPDQLCEIYSGWKDGIDASLYDNPMIPAEVMQVMRHALALGLNAEFDENLKLTIY